VTAETNQNYTFISPPNMQNASVTGYFQCIGGSPNLIEVYLMDKRQLYTKWLKNPGGQSNHPLRFGGNVRRRAEQDKFAAR